MIDRIIKHLEWMTKVLKDQHDNIPIGGGDSEELLDVLALLEELKKFKDGGLITKRTRTDLLWLAIELTRTPGKAKFAEALLDDLQEDGVNIVMEN